MTTSGEDPAQDSGDGAASEGQLLSDEDDLQAALLGLSRLVAGSDPLEALLTRVAEFAVRAIPGADGAGVTMYNDGTSSTVAASAPFVRDVDDIQYGLGEGPCISAAAQGSTIRAGSLGGDKQWPRFGPRVGRLGLHSALSLPLLVADERDRGDQRLRLQQDGIRRTRREDRRTVCVLCCSCGAQRTRSGRRATSHLRAAGGADHPGGDRSSGRHHHQPQRRHRD